MNFELIKNWQIDVKKHPFNIIKNTQGLLKVIGLYIQFARDRWMPSSVITPNYKDYFLQRPLFFTVWFRFRVLFFKLFYIKRNHITKMDNAYSDKDLAEHVLNEVTPYNESQVHSFIKGHRKRTEIVINILKSIRGLDRKNSKVLSIGPRNEAELLLFSTYGFSYKNLTGIDLFSPCPSIKVMDMHNMKFDDNSFDIVCSLYVLRYSTDVPQACKEMLRVAKDGALMVIGNTFGYTSHLVGTELAGGTEEMISYFKDNVDWVYWREEFPDNSAGEGAIIGTTIFRVKK